MKVLDINQFRALVKVFLAPSVISPQVLPPLKEKFEYLLAEMSNRFGTNIFLKRIFRAGDYYAIIVIETSDYRKIMKISNEIERRTRIMGSRLKRYLSKAIELL